MIYDHLGAIDLPSGWFDSGCGAGPRARWLPDGRVEIEGEGTPTKELSNQISKWIPTIHEMSVKHGVPMSLIIGIMMTESAGQQYAKSYCCYGLMGFLPKTASWYAGRSVTGTELQDNPRLSIELGAKMLAALMNQYKGNVIKVATSYNAGGPYCTPAKGCSSTNRWGMRSDCPGDKTVDYPTRVISYANASIASKGALPVTASSSGSSRLSGWQWAGLAAAGIAGLVWASKSGALRGNPANSKPGTRSNPGEGRRHSRENIHWVWAYHTTMAPLMSAIGQRGLLAHWHEHVEDAPVIFVEPSLEGLAPYIDEDSVVLRFKTPGFGCTEDGEDVLFSPDPPLEPYDDVGRIPPERLQVLRDGHWDWLIES